MLALSLLACGAVLLFFLITRALAVKEYRGLNLNNMKIFVAKVSPFYADISCLKDEQQVVKRKVVESQGWDYMVFIEKVRGSYPQSYFIVVSVEGHYAFNDEGSMTRDKDAYEALTSWYIDLSAFDNMEDAVSSLSRVLSSRSADFLAYEKELRGRVVDQQDARAMQDTHKLPGFR